MGPRSRAVGLVQPVARARLRRPPDDQRRPRGRSRRATCAPRDRAGRATPGDERGPVCDLRFASCEGRGRRPVTGAGDRATRSAEDGGVSGAPDIRATVRAELDVKRAALSADVTGASMSFTARGVACMNSARVNAAKRSTRLRFAWSGAMRTKKAARADEAMTARNSRGTVPRPPPRGRRSHLCIHRPTRTVYTSGRGGGEARIVARGIPCFGFVVGGRRELSRTNRGTHRGGRSSSWASRTAADCVVRRLHTAHVSISGHVEISGFVPGGYVTRRAQF